MPTLRKVLDQEFQDFPYHMLRSSEPEKEVSQVYLSTGAPCSQKSSLFKEWPGPESNVFRWFVMGDGSAIGLCGKPEIVQGVVRSQLKTTNQVDWNRLRTFQVVHQTGSFTKAGRVLQVTQSAVSRQIAALEQDVGSALFIRSSGGLVLTEAGEYFLETVNHMWQCLDLGLARLNEIRADPVGPLRITTTVCFGSAWLTSRINRFHEEFPDIEISLLLADNVELDLQRREADCAIRFQMPEEPTLVQRYIEDFSYQVYASKSYLEKRGTPKTLADLEGHDLIVYGDGFGDPPIERINWLLTEGMPEGTRRLPALHVNSVYGIYRAVESGMGLAALPFYMSERSDELVEVLPGIHGPRIPVYFVYPTELRPSRRINVLRDFLIREVRKSCRAHKPPEPELAESESA